MAKESYKIPTSLDENYLSMEIAIQSKDGVGLKPLAVRVILVWLVGFMGLFYLMFNERSLIAMYSSIGGKILFSLVWIAFIYLITQMDKSHRMNIELIPAVVAYIQKSARILVTRKTSNANVFYGLVGIDSIDDESGLVTYSDGTFAYWYAVVGSASVLLFPEDRDAILDRVDDFYKKIGTDCEIIYITTKEPQRVHKQLAHLMAQYDVLEFKDRDISFLVKEQYDVLKNFVGNEFKSLHQYMVLKGDTRDSLSNLNNVVIGEAQSSPLMFKQCVPMYRENIEEVLHLIYSNIDQK